MYIVPRIIQHTKHLTTLYLYFNSLPPSSTILMCVCCIHMVPTHCTSVPSYTPLTLFLCGDLLTAPPGAQDKELQGPIPVTFPPQTMLPITAYFL